MSVFRHAVASGDPLADRVVLWTRVTTDVPGSTEVRWRLARDPDLRDIVSEGVGTADPEHDRCVHVDVGGLEPATTYFYGFEAMGDRSPSASNP